MLASILVKLIKSKAVIPSNAIHKSIENPLGKLFNLITNTYK